MCHVSSLKNWVWTFSLGHWGPVERSVIVGTIIAINTISIGAKNLLFVTLHVNVIYVIHTLFSMKPHGAHEKFGLGTRLNRNGRMDCVLLCCLPPLLQFCLVSAFCFSLNYIFLVHVLTGRLLELLCVLSINNKGSSAITIHDWIPRIKGTVAVCYCRSGSFHVKNNSREKFLSCYM